MKNFSLILPLICTFLLAKDLKYKKHNELNLKFSQSHLSSPISNFCSDESNLVALDEYLKDANELLNLPLALKIIDIKVSIAMENTREKIVYDMINNFKNDYKNAKRYGIQEKIFYYKYLNLYLKVYTEGWDFFEKDIGDLTFKYNSDLSEENILAMKIFLYKMEEDSLRKQDLRDYLLVHREYETVNNSINELDLNIVALKEYVNQNNIKSALGVIDTMLQSNEIKNNDGKILIDLIYDYLNFKTDNSNEQYQILFRKSLENIKGNFSFFPFIIYLSNYLDQENIAEQIYNVYNSSKRLEDSIEYFEFVIKSIKDSEKIYPCFYNILDHTWFSSYSNVTHLGNGHFLNSIMLPYIKSYHTALLELYMLDDLRYKTLSNELMNSYEILEMHEYHLNVLINNTVYRSILYKEQIKLDDLMPKILSLLNKLSPEEYYVAVGDNFIELIENTDLENLSNRKYLSSISEIVMNGIKYSKQNTNYQYEYNLKLFLASIYFDNDIKQDDQYTLYREADSLQQLYDLEPDYDSYWRYVLLQFKNGDYENAFSKLKMLYNNNILNKKYYNALINLDYISDHLLLSGRLVKETSKFLEDSISDVKNYSINDETRAYLESLKLKYMFRNDNFQWIYENFEKVDVDSIILITPFVLNNSNEPGKVKWIENLIVLLQVVMKINDSSNEQILKKIIEDNSVKIKSISNDIFFNNVLSSSLNIDLKLFDKVSKRIFSYENSYWRVKYKYDLGKWIYQNNDYQKGIFYLEEALNDIRDFEFSELEVEILIDLASSYYSRGNKELFKNIFEQTVPLATSLEMYDRLVFLYELLFYSIIDSYSIEDQEKLSKNYIEYAILSKNSLCITSTISLLIQHSKTKGNLERAEEYILSGYELYKKGQIKKHHYLSISSIIWKDILIYENYWAQFLRVKNEGGTTYSNDIKSAIYASIIMLNEVSLSSLEKLKQDHPFVYLNIVRSHYSTKIKLDNIFTTKEQIEELISFLLNQSGAIKQAALLNCIWLIDDRLGNIEQYLLQDEYQGYGFNYHINNDQIVVKYLFKDSPAEEQLKPGDIIYVDQDIPITESNVELWIKDKIEANSSITKIFRSEKDKKIDLKPGSVQPNPFSKEPLTEIEQLMALHQSISDTLIKDNPNIFSKTDFTWYEKRFVLKYPIRKWAKDKKLLGKDLVIKLLNKYEKTAAFGFLNNAINHKIFLESDKYLKNDYEKKSRYLNEIQLELQAKNMKTKDVSSLMLTRNELYDDLNFFENYRTEKYGSNPALKYDFSTNEDVFIDYDIIHRIMSDGYNEYGSFIINKKNNYYGFYDFSHHEKDLNSKLKLINKTISYSALNEHLYDDFYEKLKIISKSMNNGKIPTYSRNSIIDILVIPEDQFNLFPLELMLVKTDENSENFMFLSEVANVSYAPSLSSYKALKNINSSKKRSKKALLVSSNPNSDHIINYENNLLAMRSDYGNIEFVDNEIQNIKNRMKKTRGRKKVRAKVLDSKNITEEEFKNQDLSEYKYIHIAAHGVHDKENPRLSGILLGRKDKDKDDGILQFHEIFTQNLNADLVTLSSCFSGFGEIDINEGNLGIYRSFLLAGAKSVIISLWNVEDKSTAIFFDKFYENLFDGYGKAESLRLAKMYLKNETEYNHPFFWAPFILIGES